MSTTSDNYNLDTGKKYVKDIFSAESFYSIPEYQRPYVWGKDQVTLLLDDIRSAMDRDYRKEYFLGCMIWNTKKVQENGYEYETQDILDGQQRFISLYLIQGVFRDVSTDDKLKKKVIDRMRQEEDFYDNIPERNRILFEIRDDKEFLDKYLIPINSTLKFDEIKGIVDDKSTSTSVRNIGNAILYIHGWLNSLKKEFESKEEVQKYIGRYFQYISSKVLALYLATPNNLDDAYNLFTVLNSRGLQLQVADILRAQNLRVIDDNRDRKKYAEKWSTFEDNIGLPYKEFDDFLWALVFIRMKYRSTANKSLHKAFENMWKSGNLVKGKPTFDFVGKYVNHYEAITNGTITSKNLGNYFINLNFILTSVFGNTYMSPLMYYRETFGDYRIVDFLIKLDNLLSSSWLINKRGAQTRIFILLRKMDEFKGSSYDKASLEQAADQFIDSQYLEYGYDDDKATTTIEIDDFFNLIENEDFGSYSGTRVNKTRYLLLKLDLILGDYNQKLQFDRLNSSIEHIMPRKIEDTEWQVDEVNHTKWLHKIGNLVLLNRKKNASLSNRLYNDKKSRYHGALESRANTNYVFMKYGGWGEAYINQNHDRIVNILKKYYEGNSVKTLIEIKSSLHKESNF